MRKRNKFLETIVKKNQKELKNMLVLELKKIGYSPITDDGFIYAEGDIPVMLLAHMDTVHKAQVGTIFYTPDGNTMTCHEGIGGDDRCGIYMVLNLLRRHKCHVLFTEDEEIGGVGAKKYCDKISAKKLAAPKLNFMIEFDRAHANDAVFYDCDNEDFTEFVLKYGFKETWGSFSDISIVAPELGVAAVNLSCGYYNAHTTQELIVIPEMEAQINRASALIADWNGNCFEYIAAAPIYRGLYGGGWGYNYEGWGEFYSTPPIKLQLMPMEGPCPDGFWVQEGSDDYYFIDPEDVGDYAISRFNTLYYLYDDGAASPMFYGAAICDDSGTKIDFDDKYAKEYTRYC